MTGPYHSIQSLEIIVKNYKSFRKSVVTNKKLALKNLKLYFVSIKKPTFAMYIFKT